MPFVAVFSTNRDSLPNACQIFQSECLASTNSFVYQGLTHHVIGVFLESMLSAREVLQATLSGTSPHSLQRLPPLVIAHADCMDLGTREGVSVAVSGKVHDAQIDTKGLTGCCFLWGVLVLGHMQIVGTASPHQISAPDLPGRVYQQVMLPLAWQQPTRNTSSDGIQRHPIQGEQAKRTAIIAHAATRAKCRASDRHLIGLAVLLLGTCGFNHFHGLSTGTHSQLSTQPKAGAGLAIDAMMGGIGIGDVLTPTHGSNPRGCCIEALLRLLQQGFMALDIEFDTDCSDERLVHGESIGQVFTEVKEGGAVAPVLSSYRVNAGGYPERRF